MGDLSKHFNRSEVACRCGCGANTMDYETIQKLEQIREHFDTPIIVNSGFRCEKHNTNIGGSKNSLHLSGRAVDFYLPHQMLQTAYSYCEEIMDGKGGLGLYQNSNFIHLDTRSGVAARWKG